VTAEVPDGARSVTTRDPTAPGPEATASLPVTSPAQDRVVADVLGWGAPRPLVPAGLATALRERLEDGLGAIGPALPQLARERRGGRIVVSRTSLQRAVCQGWQLAPEPYVHTAAGVRGVLGRAAILSDLRDERRHDAADVAAGCWRRLASDRPGDPRSMSAWMNRADASVRAALRSEVADLIDAVREVWPRLPRDRVELALDVPCRVRLIGGAVELASTLDLVVDSRVDDGRARRLVVDLRTGQPRAPLDLLALRFAALCSTLVDGAPPFRWSTFYVTEGRFVAEDLPEPDPELAEPELADLADPELADPERPEPLDHPLGRVVDRIIEAVSDLVELDDVAADAPESALRLAAGVWCGSCRRRVDCSVAAAATGGSSVSPA
jgi:hypothetical protein